MEITLTGCAVTEAIRSAHGRDDMAAMREICGGVGDDALVKIGAGDLEIRGDSVDGFEIYTIDRRFLWPTPMGDDGREITDRVEVTGRSERTIERTEIGMLRQMDTDRYFLDDVSVPGSVWSEAPS